MDCGCQQYCDYCPELILFLCALPFKVHDSSIQLSPGASALLTVQCGDPSVKPLHLQSEESGCEGSSEEDAGQEAQAHLLTQPPLLHQEEKLWERRGGRKKSCHSAITTFILSQNRGLSSSDPSALLQSSEMGNFHRPDDTHPQGAQSPQRKIFTASPAIVFPLIFVLSFLPLPFLPFPLPFTFLSLHKV